MAIMILSAAIAAKQIRHKSLSKFKSFEAIADMYAINANIIYMIPQSCGIQVGQEPAFFIHSAAVLPVYSGKLSAREICP